LICTGFGKRVAPFDQTIRDRLRHRICNANPKVKETAAGREVPQRLLLFGAESKDVLCVSKLEPPRVRQLEV